MLSGWGHRPAEASRIERLLHRHINHPVLSKKLVDALCLFSRIERKIHVDAADFLEDGWRNIISDQYGIVDVNTHPSRSRARIAKAVAPQRE